MSDQQTSVGGRRFNGTRRRLLATAPPPRGERGHPEELGQAAAVRPDGRANPRQTLATGNNRGGLEQLLETLLDAHRQRFDTADDVLVGLQLTHSGRIRDGS